MRATPDIGTQTARFGQSLRVTPVHNAHVRKVASERPGELALEIDLTYGPVLTVLRWIFRARKTKVVILDGVGREVYDDIDGNRTFEELIDRFSERHALTFFESRALLAQYYRTLAKNGLIVAALRNGHGGTAGV